MSPFACASPRRDRKAANVALGVALVLGAAACSGSAGTVGPSAPAAAATGGSVGAAPSAASTPSPATTTAPTAVPLPSEGTLKLGWQRSGPVTSKSSTVDSAIDPATGDLWVAVPFENRYWIFSPAGTYLASWGVAGSGDGQLDLSDHAQNPDGWGAIAFAPDGGFYIGDTGNNRVQEFDRNRGFVRAWGSFGTGDGQFTQIISIATDGKTVFVGDGDRYDIQAFDSAGRFLRSFDGGAGYDDIALDANGRIHATNPQNPQGAPFAMAILAADGTIVSETPFGIANGWALGPAVDAAGNTYVSIENGAPPFTPEGIFEVDPNGGVTRAWAGGADELTVTPAGDAIYLTRGIQLDGTQWTTVRKYALPKG